MPAGNFRILSLGNQVGIGVAGSLYVTLNAVAKENGTNAPYCIPNEYICGELARSVRLPNPPIGIVVSPGRSPMIASLDFNLTGNSLPPVDAAKCVSELCDLSTGLLLFDIWVANLDRHKGNFSVDFLSKPPRMNIFDHSHALFGYDSGKGIDRLNSLADRLGISHSMQNPVDSGKFRHCLLDLIATDAHFPKWIDRIKKVPDFFIEEICQDAQEFGLTSDDVKTVTLFLKDRRSRLADIIQKNQKSFSKIKSWSLFQ